MLHGEGKAPKRLVSEKEPHAFPADVATAADLIDGTVIDFNVMSRRKKVAHQVRRLRSVLSSPAGSTRLALCSSGALVISSRANVDRLNRYDAALLREHDVVDLAPDADSEFYLVTFRPV